MDAQAEQELNTIALRMYQRRGLYTGFNLDDYQVLKEKEGKITQRPDPEMIPLEEVIMDFRRNGTEETQLMPKAFLTNTSEESRTAYRFGHQDSVIYFATGTYLHNNILELGLIGSHVPGSPGGGGWGLNGIRKLQLVKKPFWKRKFNWERWINNTLAYAYEHYDEKIHYKFTNENESSATLLRMAIERAKANYVTKA